MSRTAVEAVVCFLTALFVIQTWFIDGLAVPCLITSGSMAEALLGPHRNVVCADCGCEFSCDVIPQPVSTRAVCQNCGYAKNNLELPCDLDGDRVLIDRLVYNYRPPHRWEIAAFRHPAEAGKIVVKRVVGLPGESVEICHGDVYIDGKIQRKTLAQQQAMAVLVYDANYSSTRISSLPPRWQSEGEKSRWNLSNARITYPDISKKGGEKEPSIDWLCYRHWRRLPGEQNKVEYCPVYDLMGYNQTLPRREEDVSAVEDLLLSFQFVNVSGRGKFFIRTTIGENIYLLELNCGTGDVRATLNNNTIQPQIERISADFNKLKIVVSTIDRQFIVEIDGRSLINLPIDDNEQSADTKSVEATFALGVEDLGVEIENLRIFRDVYYTHPIGVDGRWAVGKSFQLGGRECFVLGDNSSISEDSRTWPKNPAVRIDLLIGKPLFVIFPARAIGCGGWDFQVPDFGKIRYIR